MSSPGCLMGLLVWLLLLQPVLCAGDRTKADCRGGTLASPVTLPSPQTPDLAVAPRSPAFRARPLASRATSASAVGEDLRPPVDSPRKKKELFPQACGNRTMRVVGGRPVPKRKWPWQVSLQVHHRHVCGGSLISSRWVLTAAHCIQSQQEYTVKLGDTSVHHLSPTAVEIPAKDIAIHQHFSTIWKVQNDIALVLLAFPVNFSSYIQPVCLPQEPFRVENGTLCWVTGWGQVMVQGSLVRPNCLQEAEQYILLQEACNAKIQRELGTYRNYVHKGMICGYHKVDRGPCRGDSGGPLVCEVNELWVQVGIVSWGVECGKEKFPAVYTDVIQYKEWVKRLLSHVPCVNSVGLHILLLCLLLHLAPW